MTLAPSCRVLLAINDGAIEDFLTKHPGLSRYPCIHFSGAHQSARAWAAHPLQSFAHSLYGLADYQRIPFILDKDAPDFAELFPGLANPHYRLEAAQRPLYHALLMLGGNCCTLLWQKVFAQAERMGLDRSLFRVYAERIIENVFSDPQKALSGPLVRADHTTLRLHQECLEGDPFQAIHQAFVSAYFTDPDLQYDAKERYEHSGSAPR
jgi:predicted short-subunit dehydrogenase-like oxidoreductase (DUF2520 family)